MGDDWDKSKRLCGNCRYWPLASYQHDFEGAEPLGVGGYGTDGTVSDCRRHGPIEAGKDSPGKTARWPTTEKRDWCGDFEHRIPRMYDIPADYRPGDIIWIK